MLFVLLRSFVSHIASTIMAYLIRVCVPKCESYRGQDVGNNRKEKVMAIYIMLSVFDILVGSVVV